MKWLTHNKLAMDNEVSNGMMLAVEDVQIAILDENIKTTNDISSQLSTQLASLARVNKVAVRSVQPLMRQIHELKVRQRNLHAIEQKVHEVKSFAGKIRGFFDIMDGEIKNGSLDDVKSIERYIGALNGLETLTREVGAQRLDGFDGLKESLENGIPNAEMTLKQQLFNKMKMINDPKLDRDVKGIIAEIRVLFAYLTETRGMRVEDDLMRERQNYIKRELTRAKPSTPTVNNDMNFIYDGCPSNAVSFMQYTQHIEKIISREMMLITDLFKGLVSSMPRLLSKTVRLITDSYVMELKSLIDFIDMRKLAYNTMYYEIASGSEGMIEWMYSQHLEPSNTLRDLSDKSKKQAQNSFAYFFEYIKARYAEMKSEQFSETLNNTFMLIATRINKMALFRDYQLDFISTMTINSWLPAITPTGFISEKSSSTDPQFLLGSFYSDCIEYSFYSLATKFQGQRSEEDIGIMLLFNLDGFQSLLEGTSNLKQIIGQRGMERYERLKKKAMDKAVSPWSILTARLMAASTKQGDQLSMGNKELGKFVEEFYSTFDDLCLQFKSKDVPAFFRKQMATDISKTLVPSYKIFYAHVRAAGAKGAIKHLTMTPEQLATRLSDLTSARR